MSAEASKRKRLNDETSKGRARAMQRVKRKRRIYRAHLIPRIARFPRETHYRVFGCILCTRIAARDKGILHGDFSFSLMIARERPLESLLFGIPA